MAKQKTNLIAINSNNPDALPPVDLNDQHKAALQQALGLVQAKEFELSNAKLNLKSTVQAVALDLGISPKQYDLNQLKQNDDGSVQFLPLQK